jgi:hypothetical protein
MTAGVLPGLISASTSWLVWDFPTFAFAQYSCGSGAGSLLLSEFSLSYPMASPQWLWAMRLVCRLVLDRSE